MNQDHAMERKLHVAKLSRKKFVLPPCRPCHLSRFLSRLTTSSSDVFPSWHLTKRITLITVPLPSFAGQEEKKRLTQHFFFLPGTTTPSVGRRSLISQNTHKTSGKEMIVASEYTPKPRLMKHFCCKPQRY